MILQLHARLQRIPRKPPEKLFQPFRIKERLRVTLLSEKTRKEEIKRIPLGTLTPHTHEIDMALRNASLLAFLFLY